MELTYPLMPKWTKLEIGDEETVACSQCGELVSDQNLSLKLSPDLKLVVFVECEACVLKMKLLLKAEAQAEGDR